MEDAGNRRNNIRGITSMLAVALLVLAIFSVVSSAVSANTGTISFVLKYVDYENPNDNGLLSNIEAYLYDYDGQVVMGPVVSKPTVTFDDVPYGNYVVKIVSKVLGDRYAYEGKSVEVSLDSSGDSIQYVDITRYALNHTLNLTVYEDMSNSVIKPYATVKVYTSFGLLVASGTTDENGTITLNVPKLDLYVDVSYEEGGTEKVFHTKIDTSQIDLPTNQSVSVDLKGYRHVYGTVEDNDGNYINDTIRITLVKGDGSIYKVMKFGGGTFDFFVPPGIGLKMIVTADGYGRYVKWLTSSVSQFYPITLSKANNPITYKITFSEDFKTVWINKTMWINNYSIIDSMGYGDFGILYYQLKFAGYDNATKLKEWFNNSIPYMPKLKIGEYNYTLQEKYVEDFSLVYSGFSLKTHAKYYCDEVDVDKLLKDGGIPINLYVFKDVNYGGFRNYTYRIYIPSKYERSNEIPSLKIDGYINTITINDADDDGYYTIVLKERVEPSITLSDSTVTLYWKNMSFEQDRYILNVSEENFTVLVPAYTNVSINVSAAYMDNVRNMSDWQNATFTWILDGNTIHQGVGSDGCNLTYNFTTGRYTIVVEVKDVGSNVNKTNITVYADGYVPTAKINITEGEESILNIELNITGEKLIYTYNNTTKEIPINPEGRYVNVTLPDIITINESAQLLYNASSTEDTYNGTESKSDVLVEWDFNGTKSTEINKTYAFDKPTRGNETVWINVTLRDIVNNTIEISIKAKIKDTTPPEIKVKIFNESWKEVTEVDEGGIVYLDAKNTTDPENGNISSYNWTIKKSEGGEALEGEDYEIINGSLTDNFLKIKFLTYGLYYIILNVTDMDGNHAIKNISFHVNPVRPDITIVNVTIPKDIVEGSPAKIKITLKNNGKVNVTKFTVTLYANEKIVVDHKPYNLRIAPDDTRNITITWTPDAAGSYTLKINITCEDEPSIYTDDNVYSEKVKVEPNQVKNAGIVLTAVIVVIIIAVAAKKLKERKKEEKKEKRKKKEKKEKEEKKEKKKEKKKEEKE